MTIVRIAIITLQLIPVRKNYCDEDPSSSVEISTFGFPSIVFSQLAILPNLNPGPPMVISKRGRKS